LREPALAEVRDFDRVADIAGREHIAVSPSALVRIAYLADGALRDDLVQAFESRGYVLSDAPDFTVAYYASAQEKLDVTHWDYGYRYNPYWWGAGFYDHGGPEVTEYKQGTVIVDVIDPRSRELLWRGQGVAVVSDDQARYEQDLRKTVMAVLEKFPRAG